MFLGVCLCPCICVRARHVTIDCERCMRACAHNVTMGLRVSDACACACARHVTIDCERCVREIVDIDEYVQRIMKENGHYAAAAGDGDVGGEIYPISIQPNNNTLKSVLDID